MKAGQNSPSALAAADFDIDGYPDLVTGYSAPGGGILTFHKGPEL
ncbi:MAG: FG-GAP repeat protein, partial [Pyrinomonadaceae bacterium]|nr:FG-GAP repeat protein [Pyrinomonadaceae bacterium]